MTKEEAISAIKESLSKGSGTPCTWREDRDAYIQEQSAALYEAVIEPVSVNVVGEAHSYGTLDEIEGKKIFGIARRGDQWLLYVPELDSYSLAFGESAASLSILGFASRDALAEWLG